MQLNLAMRMRMRMRMMVLQIQGLAALLQGRLAGLGGQAALFLSVAWLGLLAAPLTAHPFKGFHLHASDLTVTAPAQAERLLGARAVQLAEAAPAAGQHAENNAHKTDHEIQSATEHAAGPQQVVTKELEEVGIKERVGKTVIGDMLFTNRHGEEVVFTKLFADEKPILLTFFYATCPSLCQFVLNAKADMLAKLGGLKLGKDFHAVSVSFDESDTPELMLASYKRYTTRVQHSATTDEQHGTATKTEQSRVTAAMGAIADGGWTFLRGEETAIQRLTSQLGFLYKRLERGGDEEFAHTAAMYILTPKGKISRYFYGLFYPPFDVKLALIEAKNEKERSTLDRVLLYCYRYDVDAKGYVLAAQNVMKAGGLAIIVFLAGLIGVMVKFERTRKDREV